MIFSKSSEKVAGNVVEETTASVAIGQSIWVVKHSVFGNPTSVLGEYKVVRVNPLYFYVSPAEKGVLSKKEIKFKTDNLSTKLSFVNGFYKAFLSEEEALLKESDVYEKEDLREHLVNKIEKMSLEELRKLYKDLK